MLNRIKFDVEVKSDNRRYRVEGFSTRFVPAKLTGHPDTWRPAEGGELEDVEIYMIHNERERKLKPELRDNLLDDQFFADAVYEALNA